MGIGSSIDPLEVLQTYLASREDLKDIATEMREAAQNLLAADGEAWLDSVGSENKLESGYQHQVLLGDIETQLRLL